MTVPINDMIYFTPETDSTNSEIRRLDESAPLPHGYCLITDFQTSGHGQAANRWESERGKNLLFSIMLHPTAVPPQSQFVITEIVTQAILEALQPEITDEIEIKWPNDIYVGNRKICGILIENSLCGDVLADSIIGVGININQTAFAGDAPNPASLKQLSGHDHDRKAIIEQVYDNILSLYSVLENAENIGSIVKKLHDFYMSHLYRRNGFHRFATPDGRVFDAAIESINPQGMLTLLEKKSGHLGRYAFKEVKFIV